MIKREMYMKRIRPFIGTVLEPAENSHYELS